MTTPEEAVVAVLGADATVTSLVGTRIYPQIIPSGNTLMPAIAYQRISDFPVRTLIGKSGLERPRIQIDCYANGYLEAKRIGKAVRDALDGYRAPVTVGEEQIRIAAQIVADRDFYESDTRRHRYSLDAAVWAHESTPAA